MDIRTTNRNALEARQNQIQEEKKKIETVIQHHKVTEQASIESGDGRTAIASRKAVEVLQGQLEGIGIEEDAITRRLQEYERNKPDAEKLKVEIEHLYNEAAPVHVDKIRRAQVDVVENLKTIQEINNNIDNLAAQYRLLSGEPLDGPSIVIPVALREFVRMLTNPGSQGIVHGLQPLEPYTFRKREVR